MSFRSPLLCFRWPLGELEAAGPMVRAGVSELYVW